MDTGLTSARYGDVEELRALLHNASEEERNMIVNYVQPDTLNTPLHMGKNTRQDGVLH